MKTKIAWALMLCLLCIGLNSLSAQEMKEVIVSGKIERDIKKEQEESIKKIKTPERTIISIFAPDLVIPVEERIAQKKRRIVEMYRKKEILDTLDISERKRKRLMRDLRRTPFSDRLLKATVVETKFEDEENIDLDK